MKPRARRVMIALAAVALVAVAAALVWGPGLRRRWETPLGPGLGLPTRTATVEALAALPIASPTAATTNTGPTLPPPSPTIKPSATPAPFCGGPPVSYVLGIGADNRADNYLYGLSDVMRLARIDFTIPRVTVLSLPRDLWVEIPEISDHYDLTHGKLNQAYFYGGPGMGYYDGPGGGPGLLARTLDLNFGLPVDHYGAVNMQTFVKIIDAVGGIDVYLEQPVDGRPIDDKTEDMGYFEAGQHHLDGIHALKLSRVRKKYNDLTRGDNQTLVLCALKKKVTSPEVLPRLPRIIAAFQDSIQTDLSPAQISQFACLLPKLEPENLVFASLPKEILEPGRVFDPYAQHETFVYETDFDVIRQYAADFIAGTWPTQPDEPSCP